MNQPDPGFFLWNLVWGIILLVVFWGPSVGVFLIGCRGLFGGSLRLTPNTTLEGRAARITGAAAMVGSFFCTPPAIILIVWTLMGDGPGSEHNSGRSATVRREPGPPAPPAPPPVPGAPAGGAAATPGGETRTPPAPVITVVPSPDPLPATGTLESQSGARMQRIAEAMLAYRQQHGRFPPAVRYDSRGLPQWSWRVELLPLLGFQSLYDEFQHDEPWNSRHNQEVATRMPDVYRTPGAPRDNTTCYLIPMGRGTAFGQGDGTAAATVADGEANVILLVEADVPRAVPWTQPQDLAFSPAIPTAGLGTMRAGRFLAAMADGSLQTLPTAADAVRLCDLFVPGAVDTASTARPSAQPAAGEPADADGLARARRLLAAGQAAEARKVLQSAAASQANEDVLASLRWCEAIKRPALMIRIGMVIQARMPSQASPQLQFWHATVGQPLIDELEARFAGGDFGQWYVEAMQDAPASAPAAAQRAPTRQPAAAPVPIAAGGLENLGLLDDDVLYAAAEQRRLDFLIVARVAVNRAAAGQRVADSSLIVRILDVAGRRRLYESDMLSSTRVVGSMRTGGSVADPAADTVRQIVQYIDEEIVLAPMPPIAPEVAQRRAETLSARSHDNPLPPLVELRYYQWKGLLSPEGLTECYTRILGPAVGPAVARGEREL